MLEAAIDQKLEDQSEFVRWWEETVTPNKGGDRKSKNQIPRSADLISMPKAEDLTAIRNQQVSKWRRRLQQREKYQAMLFGAAYTKAMAEHRLGAELAVDKPRSPKMESWRRATA